MQTMFVEVHMNREKQTKENILKDIGYDGNEMLILAEGFDLGYKEAQQDTRKMIDELKSEEIINQYDKVPSDFSRLQIIKHLLKQKLRGGK